MRPSDGSIAEFKDDPPLAGCAVPVPVLIWVDVEDIITVVGWWWTMMMVVMVRQNHKMGVERGMI